MMLDKIKLLLGIESTDTAQDSKLLLLADMAAARLKNLLGGIEPPESMEHIIIDVTIARFNRIGSEGLTSHSVEGESLTFTDNDFAAFSDEIQAFLEAQGAGARGRLRFL